MSRASQDIQNIVEEIRKYIKKYKEERDHWERSNIAQRLQNKKNDLRSALCSSGIANWETVYNSMVEELREETKNRR